MRNFALFVLFCSIVLAFTPLIYDIIEYLFIKYYK